MKQKRLGEIKKRMSTMNNIETTPLWLFWHAKCKDVLHAHISHGHVFFNEQSFERHRTWIHAHMKLRREMTQRLWKFCFIPFNLIKIQLNWTQIGEENIEKFPGNIPLKLLLFKKKTKIWQDTISCLFTWEWTKQNLNWNLKRWNTIVYLNDFDNKLTIE
jgi:hypothetical protein